MAPVDLPFLQVYRSRGVAYAYYRRHGCRTRLLGAVGSPEFLAAYQTAHAAAEAVASAPSGQPFTLPGSIADLVQRYRAAPEYRQLAAVTRSSYDRTLDAVLAGYGDLMVRAVRRPWLIEYRNEVQATPRTANLRLAILRRLLSYAVALEMRPDNPATGIKPLRTGGGHRVWARDEMAAMTSPAAGDLRLPVLIAFYTGQRQADVLRLLWSAIDNGWVRVRQSKTGAEVSIPLHPELAAALAETPRRAAVICTTAKGMPWTTSWLQHRFARVRAALGLAADLHFHGLRHSLISELAELGASDAEVQAVSAHKTRSMVAHYTKGARQRVMAESAIARLPLKRAKNARVSSADDARHSVVSSAEPDET